MTAPRVASPLRAKALSYLRSSRVEIWNLSGIYLDRPAERVSAWINPAEHANGASVRVAVWLAEGHWECDEHRGENSCAHRLAVQMVTGHAATGGRWTA